jgi:S-formylglutathione hydrolase
MRETWRLAPHAVAALGIGAGGQAAVCLGFRHADTFRVVAGVAGAFDFHDWYGRGTALDEMYPSRERCRQDTAILHIDPAKYSPHVWFACDPDDEWHAGNERLREKLTAFALPFTADLETRAGGHTPVYFDSMSGPAVAFVADALRQESRRLV